MVVLFGVVEGLGAIERLKRVSERRTYSLRSLEL